MVFPVPLVTSHNTSVFPIILKNVVPSEGLKIIIHSPLIDVDLEENEVTRRFEALDDVLGFIAVFDARYLNINSRKNVQR